MDNVFLSTESDTIARSRKITENILKTLYDPDAFTRIPELE